jgi:hypothetical protein
MATATWTDGASNGDMNDADNWSGGGGASGVPTSGDTIIFDDSSRDIDTNVNAFSALTSTTVYVTPGFTGTIGSASGGMQLSSNTTIYYGGGGEYAKFNPNTCTLAQIEHGGQGTFYIVGGTWAIVEASGGGRIEEDSAASVTTYKNAGSHITRHYKGTATSSTTIRNMAGTFVNDNNFDTAWNAGLLTVRESAATNTDTSSARMVTFAGGLTRWHSSGTISYAETFPGATITADGSPSSFTVSNHDKWHGSTIKLSGKGIGVTESADNWVGEETP